MLECRRPTQELVQIQPPVNAPLRRGVRGSTPACPWPSRLNEYADHKSSDACPAQPLRGPRGLKGPRGPAAGGIQNGLNKLFGGLGEVLPRLPGSGVPTAGAYCHARQKLKAEVFTHLNQVVCEEFYKL